MHAGAAPLRCRLGTATGVVVVVGGVALYLRFVKGWRLADLMYVTRASLSSLSESMKSGAAVSSGGGGRACVCGGGGGGGGGRGAHTHTHHTHTHTTRARCGVLPLRLARRHGVDEGAV
jgi:hypothetical protein